MQVDLRTLDTFLIAFADRGDSFAVAVRAPDLESARATFEQMDKAQRRARIVGRLSKRESDHVADFTAWMQNLVSRLRTT